MRHFLRHPCDIPVELSLDQRRKTSRRSLSNISLGGVACESERRYRRGTKVEMRIPMLGGENFYPGVIAWCRPQDEGFLVGIAFVDEETMFRARMVEQVCQIEQYRRQLESETGSDTPIEEVARRWIEQHAADFPQSGA